MNEYILPVKYQNVGCGISAIVAGLENTYQNYKKIELSINDIDYIETFIDESNNDFTNAVSFDNLEENKFYEVYAKLTLWNDEVVKFSCKMVAQLQSVTVELSQEMKIANYNGGGFSNFDLPREVV